MYALAAMQFSTSWLPCFVHTCVLQEDIKLKRGALGIPRNTPKMFLASPGDP
jgi:hypothetical protein